MQVAREQFKEHNSVIWFWVVRNDAGKMLSLHKKKKISIQIAKNHPEWADND